MERAENHFGGGHGGAGIACGDEAAGLALADHLEADPHGAVALGADGRSGLVVHADPLAGLDEEDGRALAFAAARRRQGLKGIADGLERIAVFRLSLFEGGAQFWAQDFLWAHQVDADVQLAGSQDCPANLRVRGLVGPHGIENDVDWHAL